MVFPDELHCAFLSRRKLEVMERDFVAADYADDFIVVAMAQTVGLEPDNLRVTNQISIRSHASIYKSNITGKHGADRLGPGLVPTKYHRGSFDRNAVHSIYPKAWTEFQCREPGRKYSLRELITGDDWCEWQANTLASELLMPTHLIYGLLKQEGYREKVKVYPKDRLLFDERRLIRNMTDFLGVSKSALLIRLKQLNLLDYRSWDEYLEEEEFDSLLGGY